MRRRLANYAQVLLIASCFVGLFEPAAHAQVNVTTQHNDNARTGQNAQETVLTPANVNSSQFGKLFSVVVDGVVFAQPLYRSGVTIKGGTHNVLYVATEHDSLYALDADNGTILWQISLINPSAGVTTVSTTDVNCSDIKPEIGITSTPVIDTTTNTIYVLARTKENTNFFQRLHAIDAITGAEKFGGPVAIQASMPGTGDGSSGGILQFDPLKENPRAGLLLQNGHVIMAWSSLCDSDPYHGWVMSYNAGTLAQEGVFNDTRNGSRGGIWMGGAGSAGDGNGNTYLVSGNGTFNGTDEFGDSIFKLGAPGSGSFPLSDYFTPYNQATLASGDLDLGSGGVILLPDLPAGSPHQHLLVEAGKQGTIYLIDRDNLGKYCSGCSSDTQIVQELPAALIGQWGAPAYWNGNVYFGSANEITHTADFVKAFSFNAGGSGLLSRSPTSETSEAFLFPAVSPSVSANGSSNGILWLLDNAQFGGACCQALHAYDAANLANELYNSNQDSSRDGLGSGVKFTVPTIANGKVYVPGLQVVTAYGLLNSSGGGTGILLATRASGAYHNSSVAASSVASSGFLLPAGELIVAYCGNNATTATTPTISDLASNAFLQVGTTVAASGGDSISMFYAANAQGSSNDVVTCRWGSAQTDLAVMALIYSGAAPSSPLDAFASGTARGSTTIQTSPFSTTSANEVIVAGEISGSGCNPAPQPGSGYTMELNAVPSGCAGPLAAAEDEVVTTTQANSTASMTFSSNTWADMIVATFKAGSSGSGSPTASLSPTSLTFTSQQVGTTSSFQPVTLTNSGSASLSINSIAITGTNSGDFAQTNNCGTNLAAGTNCSINVTFTPSAAGTRAATLTVTDNASGSPQIASLNGTGTMPAVTLSPSSLTFGNQPVGTSSASQAVTLSNTGNASLSISSTAISPNFAATNNCGSSLAAGSSCAINVTFTPSSASSFTGTLTITDNASGSPQTVSLSGTGTSSTGGSPPAVVQVAYNTHLYDTSLFTSFSINTTNTGGYFVTTKPGDLLVAFVRESSNGTDNFTVTDSAGQAWALTSSGYKNESSTGPRIGMFYIPNSKAVTSVTVNYTTPGGVMKPSIMVMEISAAAGTAVLDSSVNNASGASVTTSTSGSLTTTNANDILIFATDTAGDQSAFCWTPGAGYTIWNNPNICNLGSGFDPIGATGEDARQAMQYAFATSAQTQTATLMTYTNSAWNGNIFAAFKLPLTSGSPVVSFTPTNSRNFWDQLIGTTSAPQTVTLTNSGGSALNISSISTSSTEFGETNNCPTSLAAGASCTISVTFTPAATGNRTGALLVASNATPNSASMGFGGFGEQPLGSGFGFVQVLNNLDAGTAAYTSFSVGITNTPGDLLVALVRESSNGSDNFTVTDSAGQTWTQTASGYKNESNTGPRIGMFYIANSKAINLVTANYTTPGGVIKPGIMLIQIAGAATSGVADGSVNSASGASLTTSSSGHLSTTNAADLLIFATDTAGGQPLPGWSPGSGYAIPNNKLMIGASGSNLRMAMQYAVVTSTQTNATTSMTYVNSNWNGNIFAAFK